MPVVSSSTSYNGIATAFGLVMTGHGWLSERSVDPIWFAVVIVFSTSAWTFYQVRARWIVRLTVALNAVLAFLLAIILASLVFQRDHVELSATAMAPRILIAGLGLLLVTTNIRWLLRRWQLNSPPRGKG